MKLILNIVILSVIVMKSLSERTYEVNCRMACKLIDSGVARDDGTVDVFRLVRELYNLNSRGTSLRVLDIQALKSILDGPCQYHKHESEDVCDTVGLLLDCVYNAAIERGESWATMLYLLTLPHDSRPDDPEECQLI